MEFRRPLIYPHGAPETTFDAMIFDCDGTIADSMPLHLVAWNDALSRWGARLEERDHYAWAGTPMATVVARLNQALGLSMPVGEVVRLREERYFELLPSIRAIPFVHEQILRFSGKLPLAVVSGSPRESVLKTLGYLGLADRFAVILGAEDYSRGKPDPEGFRLAASRLGAAPERCIVFEDAEYGVQAARGAGMKWIKIPSPELPSYVCETPRFWLREIIPDDAPVFFDLNSDPDVVRYTGDGPFASVQAAHDFLTGYDHYARYAMGRWAVISKTDGECAGWCGLKTLENGETDLGYRLFKKDWGKGIATETSEAVLRYGFETLGLSEIIGQVDPANVASIRVLEKLGMKQVGETTIGATPALKYSLRSPRS